MINSLTFFITLFLVIIISLIIFFYALYKNLKNVKYLLIIFFPCLYYSFGSGTISGPESIMYIYNLPITFLGILFDIENSKFNHIEVVAQTYSFLFGIFILLLLKFTSRNKVKKSFSKFYNDLYRNKILVTFSISIFILCIYYCYESNIQYIHFSNPILQDGLYKSRDFNYIEAFSRIFSNFNYKKDIWFFSLVFLGIFTILFIFFLIFKNKFNSLFCSLMFIIFFPTVSIGNNLIDKTYSESFVTRSIVIYPLSYTFFVTIKSFYQDNPLIKNSENEFFYLEYNRLTQVKFYSLFQIGLVIVLLPSLLISKEKKDDYTYHFILNN